VRGPGGELTTLYYGEDDRLIALQRGDQRYYVATDQVGTPKLVTDATGKTVKTLDYDSYGRRTPAGETGADFELPIGFAGGLEDPLTKLVRFGMRDYEPASGRWTSRDPLLHTGGMNLYAYATSDPVGRRDPSGMDEGGGGGFMGFVNSVAEFFTSDTGSTAVEVVSSIDSDSPIVEGAGKLGEGMEALETIQDVAETVVELKEASEEPTDPEQAAGYLKCGLKWIKKILPIDLVGTEAASEVLDKGMEHARDQRDFGTINRGAARQLAEIGMN
jgi:RHS repeat-associated protein